MLEAVQIRKQPDRMASVTKMARDLAFLSPAAARAFNLQGAPYWQEEEKRRERVRKGTDTPVTAVNTIGLEKLPNSITGNCISGR